jgi:AraC-like DNA-binding protein
MIHCAKLAGHENLGRQPETSAERPISKSPTVFARSVRKIAAAVEPRGNARHLLRAVGLDREALRDPALRIPYADLMMLSELGARITKDVAFGLHVGESVEQNSYGIVGYSVVSSATLGEALRTLQRYLPIWTNVGSFKLDVDRSVAHFQWKFSDTSLPEPRHDVEMTMATVAGFNRLSRGADWTPREVWFEHAKPKDVSEHARIFRAPVRFGMPVNSLLLDGRLLGLPLTGASPMAHQIITEAAEQLLAVPPGAANLTQSLLSFIRQRLCSGDFGLQDASRHLGVSRRTLQRRLREDSSSHRLLVEQARRDLSRCLLLGAQATATEAAYALGFSDPAAFHHAFQRWHGMPPQAYRDANMRHRGFSSVGRGF